jgi:hypothetical protein
VAPLLFDEALTSEQAQTRVDALRDQAHHLATLRNEAYAASREAKRAIGEIEVELARASAAARGPAEAMWRPGQTMIPVATHDPVSPARVAELRVLLHQWKERAEEHDARARGIVSQMLERMGEANVFEAREAERFRTGLLLSPTGSILPPRIVERRAASRRAS